MADLRVTRQVAEVIAADPPPVQLLRVTRNAVEVMAAGYPELLNQQDFVTDVVTREEARFRQTLQSGHSLLESELETVPAGGLLSEGHCSGANLVSEAVRQIRREVEPERQVAECARVLVTGEGDFHEGAAMILGAVR